MFDHTYDTIFVQSMVNRGFMMKMMKFQKMPLFKLPMSQNMWEIIEISQIATQISALLYQMREIDEVLIMAKGFANTFSNL